MIRSMTGYSSGRSDEEDFSLSLSVKSTNHRFLDVQLRLPMALEPLEPEIRRQLKDRVARGHLDVTVTFERTGAQSLELNRRMLEGYVAACDGLRREFGVLAPPDPVALLRIPGMIAASDGAMSAEMLARVRGMLERLEAQALDDLQNMRDAEGSALEVDLRARLTRLGKLVSDAERLAESVPELYRKRLGDRLSELSTAAPGAAGLEPARLAQEVLYFASRSDITEELTRFQSHLAQAAVLIDRGGEVGKKLDFLLQEMNREANTILSKTTDVPEAGSEIGGLAIEMKTEVEKLREQAQNIE
jgi:uncharacterized protein (TIGR00255 family)